MYERRELTRNITIPAKHLQRNIQSSFLSQIKATIEGRCGTEGYVQPRSSSIVEYSLGTLNILQPGVQYRVKFQCDICYPHKGQILKAPVTFRSKIGIHSEVSPLRILLPRDLHIGNSDFESIQENDEIEFEVVGSEFKQNDENIFVLGRLVKKFAQVVVEEAPAKPEEPVVKETAPEEETKSVTFAPPVEEKKEPVRRKRRLAPTTSLTLNVSGNGATESASGEAGPV